MKRHRATKKIRRISEVAEEMGETEAKQLSGG